MSSPIDDLKHELLAAAERQQAHAAPSEDAQRWASARAIDREHEQRGRALRRIRKRPGYMVLATAALAAAAAAALFVSTPWNSSPGVLERAQAALTPPAGTILHQRWEMTWISTNPACTVTRGPSEIWIDQEPPHRYRALLNDLPPEPPLDPRALVCSKSTKSELGGTLDPHCSATGCEPSLRFTPPNKFIHQQLLFRPYSEDSATRVREWLGAGLAHDEGKTQLDGRTVERIRLDPPRACPPPGCPREPIYLYVDPETFYPVEIHGYGSIAGPWYQIVIRYLTYEYLPRTAANLALTDIRAQHPNAVGP
ncbi:MAG TPA: hypothetical protein VFO26_01550 [Gaiella sp.]|uniref:hypothetical protein n=1 Tax=Gaiella sp. TaxID=2663207 RepID=UPI002D7FA4AE|nr:hypothetical protein [Gaiella sp.]HET9286217.1 hypothetical protein [Gaiella sp.]